eukprot:549662-Rhodomonas_salina.2
MAHTSLTPVISDARICTSTCKPFRCWSIALAPAMKKLLCGTLPSPRLSKACATAWWPCTAWTRTRISARGCARRLCRWMGADQQAMLLVHWSGKLAAVIFQQQQHLPLLGDLIDDCNMVEFNNNTGDKQDKAIFEEDEEEEEEVE